MRKIKIGILVSDFNSLQNWELRIIEKIKNDPNLKLTLLIKDGRFLEESNNFTLSEFIFEKQVSFEKNRYLKNNQKVYKQELIKYLNTIPVLEVKPKSSNYVDIFSLGDSQIIKNYNLDIILKHGFNIILGDILNAAKHGIWLLIHGDSSKISGPSGFWEILTKQSVVEVTLVQLTKKQDKGLIIDKAYFNRHNFSFVETNTKVLGSSVSLLFKNIKKLELEEYSVSSSIFNYNTLESLPKLGNTIKYSFNYFNNLFNGLLNEGFTLLGKKRTKRWTLFIGNGNFMDSDLSILKPIKLPKDEFWADPFLFKYQEQYYVFFENYSYKTKKGKISCGRVKNNELIDIVDVLDLDYHLSYPFIFEEEGYIYMMPETSQNKRLEIYKCINFPDQWEIYTTAFEGEGLVDAFFFNDHHKQKWLFLNKKSAPNTTFNNELFIYKVDSIKLNNLIPHKQNPVIIDARVARNGGAIFNYHNKIYRPSQSNTDGVYGKALNINQILKLTIDEYKEEIEKEAEPNFQKGLVSMHHLHQIEGMFVLDVAYKKI